MTATTAYTPLEALLFFRNLSAVGVEPSSFSKISDSLKDNEFIREAKTFDAGRLSPDSLRELYLSLLKEEIRCDKEAARLDGRDVVGDQDQQNSRKRKLSTPPLASVSEAAQHTHLLPQLITRLYTRYRQQAIVEIREEERRYDLLKRDIEEIERGSWDERLERRHDTMSSETTASRPGRGASNGHGNLSMFLNDSVDTSSPPARTPLPGSGILDSSKEQHNGSHGSGGVYTKQRTGSEPIQSQHGPAGAPDHPRSGFSPYHRSVPLTATSHSTAKDVYNVAQSTPRPLPSYGPVEGGLSYLPPPHQTVHGYRLSASSSDSHRPLPYPPPLQETGSGSLRSPDVVHNPVTTGRTSASPVILPPPPGMHRTPVQSTRPLDTLADMAGQQYRAHPPSQPLRHSPMSPAPQSQGQLSQPRGYFQSPYQFPPRQAAYTGPYQTHTPQGMPPQYSPNPGPSTLPPFQSFSPVPPQPPGQHQQHQFSSQQHRSSLPAYARNSGSASNIYHPAFNQTQKHAMPGQSAALSTPVDKRRLLRLSPIDTSGSSTKWKANSMSRPTKSPGSPTPPGPEDVSPISERALSPEPGAQPEKKPNKGRKDELKPQLNTSDDVVRSTEERPTSETSSTNARGGRGHVSTPRGRGRGRGRGRAGSTTSSAIAGSAAASTRSQSVISHADELSMDTGTVKARNIKNEPPATPAGMAGDEDTEMTETTPDEGSRSFTRKRRATLKGSETTDTPGTSKKRKRVLQDPPEEGDTINLGMAQPGPNKSDYIFASRNFPRTSATIMNDVTAHKLASMFAKPLTEREAPGYKDLIYRPQDLKSIKSAISAGSRAVAAAAETVGTPAGEAGSPLGQGASTPSLKTSGSLWIPKTADVVPPKGIVKSAQLEKELMRMFANAIMFNPEPKRGFGPAFKLREKHQHGGDEDGVDGRERAHDAEDEEEEEDEEEDGGVVKDTREMFQVVEKSVAAWRAAERAVEDGSVRTAAAVAGAGAGAGAGTRGRKEEDEADELAGEEGGEDKDKDKDKEREREGEEEGQGQGQGQGGVKRRRRA